MNWDLISAVIFYSILFILIYRYRRKFEVMQKVFFVYKTQRGIDFMQKIAKLRPFWKIFSTIAIPVSIFCMIKLGQFFAGQIPGMLAGTAEPAVSLAIPGVQIPGSPIFIPFWYGIISLAVLVVVHEMSHGIVAAMEGVKIKSCGFGFLAILPLAFVEIDEEQLKEMPTMTKLRVAASGSFGNLSLYLVIILIWIFISIPFVNSLVVQDGVLITSVAKGTPAQIAGLEANTRVISINGQEIVNSTQFVEFMQTVSPGDNITLGTNVSTYQLSTIPNAKNASLAYMGVYLDTSWHFKPEAQQKYGILLGPIMWFDKLLYWIATLNLAIGIINFLPIWFLDGGRIAYDSLSYVIKSEKWRNLTALFIFSVYLFLFLVNIFGPYVAKLIT